MDFPAPRSPKASTPPTFGSTAAISSASSFHPGRRAKTGTLPPCHAFTGRARVASRHFLGDRIRPPLSGMQTDVTHCDANAGEHRHTPHFIYASKIFERVTARRMAKTSSWNLSASVSSDGMRVMFHQRIPATRRPMSAELLIGDGEAARLVPHPLRAAILGEVHARPFTPIAVPPASCISPSIRRGAGANRPRQPSEFCESRGLPSPLPAEKHHRAPFGTTILRWEQHSEFTTYTWEMPADPARCRFIPTPPRSQRRCVWCRARPVAGCD